MDSSLSRMLTICALSLVAACSGGSSPTFDPGDTALPDEDAIADGSADAPKDGDAIAADGDVLASDASDATSIEADAIDTDTALPCDAPIRCFVDADGDGYAKSDGSYLACTCPKGTLAIDPTTAGVDCNDDNPNVHPGVTTYHDTPYCIGTGCTTKSFDYDCNGAEDKQTTTLFTSCSSFLSGCTGAGWAAKEAPACGTSADYTTCATGLTACTTSNASKKQACR